MVGSEVLLRVTTYEMTEMRREKKKKNGALALNHRIRHGQEGITALYG